MKLPVHVLLLASVLLLPVAARAQMTNPYGPAIGAETAKKIAANAVAEARKNG
jgi:xanthine/CO dehydrogenase XdhC/CoxF family maturation factor